MQVYATTNGRKQIAHKGKRINYARYLMQQHLGRKLWSWEHVHHINGDHTDDRIENLTVLDHEDHCLLHSNKLWSERPFSHLFYINKAFGITEKDIDPATTEEKAYLSKILNGLVNGTNLNEEFLIPNKEEQLLYLLNANELILKTENIKVTVNRLTGRTYY